MESRPGGLKGGAGRGGVHSKGERSDRGHGGNFSFRQFTRKPVSKFRKKPVVSIRRGILVNSKVCESIEVLTVERKEKRERWRGCS